MKPLLFALATLALGSAIGWIGTRIEFASQSLAPPSVTSTAGTGSGQPAGIGPKAVVVNGASYDFGTIDRFASDSHEFEVRNDGDAPLTLTIGKTTCKCTNFAADKNALAPGEKALVKLEWTVKTGGSTFEQSAALITNDPKNNPLELTIRGTVVDVIRPDRPQLSLGDLSANEPQTLHMRIHAFRNRDLKIESHEWVKPDGTDHFDVSWVALSPAEAAKEPGALSGVELTLQIAPGLPLGPLAQTLRLTTNLKGYEPLEIPVVGTMVSDVSLVGGSVNSERLRVDLGTLEQGVEHKRTVYLVVKGPYRDQTRLNIDHIEPAQEVEAVIGEPIRDNPRIIRYPLKIVIPASAPPAIRNSEGTAAQIKLAIEHPQVKEMTVRVRYNIK